MLHRLKGYKYSKRYEIIFDYLPKYIKTYIEPFGGNFGMGKLLMKNNYNVDKYVYNDKNKSIFEDYKDFKYSYNEDYKTILNKFNKKDSFIFLDPPYYGKEYYYEEKFYEHKYLNYYLKNKSKFKFTLFYNNCEYIKNLYNGFNIVEMPTDIYRNEIFITNH